LNWDGAAAAAGPSNWAGGGGGRWSQDPERESG